MSSNNSDLNIVKNVRIIEWLKAELLIGIGILFKSMIKNNEEAIIIYCEQMKKCGIFIIHFSQVFYKS